MRTEAALRWAGRLLVATGLACGLAGCAATRFSSPEHLSATKPSAALDHSFYVESVQGGIEMRLAVDSQSVSPGAADINRLLRENYPAVFSKKDGAVPLHVEYSGTVAPLGTEAKEFNPLIIPFFWRYRTGGKIAVGILLDNQGRKRIARIPYQRTRTESLLFWPLLVPGEHDWPVSWGIVPDTAALHPVFADLIAAGVVKALNRMDAGELGLLAAQAHQTEEQKRLLAWLTDGPGITVSVGEDGTASVATEHEYVAVPVDMGAARALPKIMEQRYDDDSRTGIVRADASGCDAAQAVDWLTTRLIPAICRTKGVVFDPEGLPPAGARFRVLELEQETENGKDCINIRFQAVE